MKRSIFVMLGACLSIHSFSQTILVDDFNRADNNTVGNGWTEIEGVATASRIVNNRLQLGPYTTASREFAWQDLSTFASPIVTNGITNNTGVLTWAFNFRNTRTDPSGFDATNYGIAFVLCKSTTPVTSGNGYAVVIGQSGATDAIRLASFTGGGDVNTEYTNVISGGDFGNEYISVRVTYNAVTDQWSLYAESNATAFPQADPRNTATQIGSTTVNTTYTATGNDLRYFGAYWNHNTDNADHAIFDDIYAPVTSVVCTPTATVSNFSPVSGSAGTIVTITGTGLNTVSQVLFGGVAATSFTTVNSTTITAELPATALSGKITVVDGASCSFQSTGDFTVLTSNANCGIGATGTNLIISEVFDSNAGSVGYVEIFNPTGGAINLNGYFLRINTGAVTNLVNFNSFSLASGAVAVIRIGDPTVPGSTLCGGVTVTQAYNGAPGFNDNDDISLVQGTSPGGTVIDVVTTPPVVGFSLVRNTGAITPRTTFQPSEWTTADPETCGNLGVAPSSITPSNVTITTQPADVNCAPVTFSVIANATPGTINYTWRYQAPGETGWTLVSSLGAPLGLTVTGSGTATISITGNTAILRDYQFHCEIGSGGSPQCNRYTNTVQYTYNSLPFYRSVGTGQWTNPATWEMSNNEAGPYIAACQYPTAQNSNKVNILNLHNVTLDVIDVEIDWVNINNGATLTVTGNSLLTFNNGNTAGADLEVNGTLIDDATNSNGINFTASSGAAWIMAPNATLIRSNGSAAAPYRDNYQGGMTNIPATANWIIRFQGTTAVTFTSTATSCPCTSSFPSATFYPNLTIESTSGNWNPVSGQSRFTGSTGGFVTVKGNLDIGGTGAGTVTVYNENTNATAMLVLGNLTVRNGSTLTNIGNASGTGFEVRGNITVNGTLNVTGITGTAGTLTVSGTATQTVSGTGAITLNNYTVNNSSVVGVNHNIAVSMNGALTLTDGYINIANPANLLTLTATATSGGGSFVSFVNGRMRKIGNSAFVFPVGKVVGSEFHFRPIEISAPAAIAETYTAEFFRINPNTIASINPAALADGLSHISRCEYWDLERSNGSTNVNVTLSWSNNTSGRSQCNVLDPTVVPYVDQLSALVVVPLQSSLWGDQTAARYGQSWTSGSVAPPAPNLGFIRWDGPGNIGAYEKFTLGSTDFRWNPLPFEFGRFTATRSNEQVALDWNVSNNERILQYTIERSRDGINFEQLLTAAPKPFVNEAAYTRIDASPVKGWNYYRLRATDREQKNWYSAIRKVWMGRGPSITLGPNPVTNILNVRLDDPATVMSIQLINSTGQVLLQSQIIRSLNQFTVDQLPAGTYFIRVIGTSNTTIHPFVK